MAAVAANATNRNSVSNDMLALTIGVLCAMSVCAPSRLVQGFVVVIVGSMLFVVLATKQLTLRAADWFMILWTLTAALSWLGWTQAPEATGVAVRTQLGVCAVFVLIRAVAPRPRVLTCAMIGYIVGCFVVSVGIARDYGLSARDVFSSERLVLEGLDQNYLAYALVASWVILPLLMRTRGAPPRLMLVAVGVFALLAATQAGTRGAFVGLALLVAWWCIYRFAPRLALRVVLLAIVFASLASLTGWADDYLRSNAQETARESGDLNGRLVVWPYARQVFEDNPLFGAGAGAFRAINPLGIVAHNAPLEVAAGLGLIGLALFFGTLYCALIVESRDWEPRQRALATGGFLVMATPILLTGHWYQAPAMWVLVAVISCSHLLQPRSRKKTRTAPTRASLGARPPAGQMPKAA